MAIGILNSAISGLAAFQRSLDVTSNNIANVSTEGYSRQRVELQTSPEQYIGKGYLGSGVNATNVKRAYDEFVNNQVRSSSTAFNDVNSFYLLSTRIDNLLADQTSGLSSAMKSFFNSVNDVANDPTSLPARQVMLSEGDAIANHFNMLSVRFEDIRQQVNNNLDTSVQEVNGFAKSIADLNKQITDDIGKSSGQQLPNALMDQRDLLLAKMAEKTDISVVPQPDGSFSVFMGQGQPLVLGGHASSVTLQRAANDPTRTQVMLDGQDITKSLSGGEIYGNLRFRDQMLDPAQQQLGLLATGFATEFNAIYQTGYDLQNNSGIPFFDLNASNGSLPDAQVKSSTADATLKVTAKFVMPTLTPNPAKNLGASYRVDVTATVPSLTYTLTNLSDNNVLPLTGLDAATLATRAAENGFSISFSGGAQTSGDSFLVSPQFNIANTIKINPAITNPSQIAAASSSGLAGDNGIALKLAGLESQNLMQGGRSSFTQVYGQMVASVGSQTHTASVGQSAQQVLLNQAIGAREDLAGVNLDEEAANLIKFQNAYQASAKAVSIASTLFDTIIGMVR
jgi:flagellar hook-associated protein 1